MMRSHSKTIYRCIDCRCEIDYNQRIADGVKQKHKFTELYCHKCYSASFYRRIALLRSNYSFGSKEHNWVIDEYFVRRDLKKDSYMYDRLYQF